MATVTDSYNRVDNATTLGTADSGQSYAPQGSTVAGIISNQAYIPTGSNGTAGAVGTVLIDPAVNDVDATIQITYNSGSLPGLVVRALNEANRLGLFINATQVELFRTIAGTGVVVASAAHTRTVGQQYTARIVCNGASITGYVDGVALINYTLAGADLTQFTGAGYTPVGFRASSGTRFDNLSATALAVPPPARTRGFLELL